MRRLLLIALLLLPASALANGAYSHVHISQLAVNELPEGPLKALLSDPHYVAFFEAGSMFPDSGYAVNDGYGERAHWAPFHSAFIAHIQEVYGDDLDSVEARERIAFLLGVMSHGLADQTYDTTLLERGLEVDGNRDEEFDRLADYFIIVDEQVEVSTEALGPYDEISQVFDQRRGYTVTPETLSRGMAMMESVMFIQEVLAWGEEYLIAWNTYPWLGTHIYNPQASGSLPHLSTLVAAHWQVIWKRIHGADSMDTDLLIATIPEDGAVNFPVDASESEAYSRVGLVLGYGVDRAQITPLIHLTDASGAPVPISVRTPYNGENRNFFMIDPDVALAYDTLYTVTLDAGIQNLEGEVSAAPYNITFRTRCAPDRLDDCPPLPDPLVTGEVPTEVPPEPQPAVEPEPEPDPELSADPDSSPELSADPDPTPTSDMSEEASEELVVDVAQGDAGAPLLVDDGQDDGCSCQVNRSPGSTPRGSGGIMIVLGGVFIFLRRRLRARDTSDALS